MRTLNHETYFLTSAHNDAQLGNQLEESATSLRGMKVLQGVRELDCRKVGFAMVTPPTPLKFTDVLKTYADFTLLHEFLT